jgi:hypothetical protein
VAFYGVFGGYGFGNQYEEEQLKHELGRIICLLYSEGKEVHQNAFKIAQCTRGLSNPEVICNKIL